MIPTPARGNGRGAAGKGMANREHVEILRNGASEWNAWRRDHPRVRPDLRGVHLAEAKLRRYDLRHADLRGSSLLAANLDDADLRQADLSECDLRYCSWSRARLAGAKLRDARGVDDRLHRAAERVDWGERLRTAPLTRIGVGVAVFALMLAAAERGLPDRSQPIQRPALGLAAALGDIGFARWEVEGVAISGGLMRIRLDVEELSEEAYIESLEAACRALEGRTLNTPVERIEVLRLDGRSGWLFERASGCGELLQTPLERRALRIAAGSLPIRPKPNPAPARGDR